MKSLLMKSLLMKPLFLMTSLAALLLAVNGSASVVMAQQKTESPATKTDKTETPAQRAQTPTQKAETPAAPAANPADVASMDTIIAAVYDVISGPAGKKRDWDRMRSLFVPGARLIPTGPRQGAGISARVLTVEEYITRASAFFEQDGFFERETARRTETFGSIAHAFSTYESRHKPEDPQPFQRGINSIQLMNDGQRWWIVTIFWQGEDKEHPLPQKYLKSGE